MGSDPKPRCLGLAVLSFQRQSCHHVPVKQARAGFQCYCAACAGPGLGWVARLDAPHPALWWQVVLSLGRPACLSCWASSPEGARLLLLAQGGRD